LLIDVHPHPETALVDGAQALAAADLPELTHELTTLATAMGRSYLDNAGRG